MQLKMEPQSAEIIPPKSDNSVTQMITVNNPNKVILLFDNIFSNDKQVLIDFI